MSGMPTTYPMQMRRAVRDSDQLSERVITPMSPAMVQAIADWRFENRCESKAEAVRRLIQLGLESTTKKRAKG